MKDQEYDKQEVLALIKKEAEGFIPDSLTTETLEKEAQIPYRGGYIDLRCNIDITVGEYDSLSEPSSEADISIKVLGAIIVIWNEDQKIFQDDITYQELLDAVSHIERKK